MAMICVLRELLWARFCAVFVIIFVCLAWVGCQTMEEVQEEEEVLSLRVPQEWARRGTMVTFMPEKLRHVKVEQEDPMYREWERTLIEFVQHSEAIVRVEQVGVLSRGNLRARSDQIPSSEYSLLLVGLDGQALHVPEPLLHIGEYQAAEDYLLGRIGPDALPGRFEIVRLIIPGGEDDGGGALLGQ